MAIEKVTVAIDDKYQVRFSEMVQRWQEAGLEVEQELEDIGVVIGSIDSEKMSQLQHAEGVAAVESERNYQIAPPDSSIQSKDERKPQ